MLDILVADGKETKSVLGRSVSKITCETEDLSSKLNVLHLRLSFTCLFVAWPNNKIYNHTKFFQGLPYTP
jgi:hypothetical protein